MADPTEHVHIEVSDRVATLTLNRPDKLNALSDSMIRAGTDTLERWATDPNVGCIVVTGAGRGFCAGGDISAMGSGGYDDQTLEERVDRQRAAHRFPWLLHDIPKVTIAAVNGAAAGAGLGLALSCDLRFASSTARFTTAFAKVGFGGDFGVTWQLARLAGEAKAKELLFLSDLLDADRALGIGLVNRVFPSESFGDEVRKIARRIANGPQVSFRYMKSNVHAALAEDFRASLDREAVTHLRCGQTEDHKEGVRAFLEKREPRFLGR
jgi:2-(1,2-epoxy-1,2-dihydrophenyl)acetyl-CoA isomerase